MPACRINLYLSKHILTNTNQVLDNLHAILGYILIEITN